MCGVVFNLKPPPTACRSSICSWTETVLYQFSGENNGAWTPIQNPVFDDAGNLYGATLWGGAHGLGAVYQLTPSPGGWQEKILYNSQYGGPRVIMGKDGNLYGVEGGVYGNAVIFELECAGNDWNYKEIYQPPYAAGDLSQDNAGNLYGRDDHEHVFMLSPSGDGWVYQVIFSIGQKDYVYWLIDSLAIDAKDNLYLTSHNETSCRGLGCEALPAEDYQGHIYARPPGGSFRFNRMDLRTVSVTRSGRRPQRECLWYDVVLREISCGYRLGGNALAT